MKIKKHTSLKEVENPKTSDIEASIIPTVSSQRELDKLTGRSGNYNVSLYDDLKNSKIIIEFFDNAKNSKKHGFDTRFIFDGGKLIIYYGRVDNYVSLILQKKVNTLIKDVVYYVSQVETVGNIKDVKFLKTCNSFTIIQPDKIEIHNPLTAKKKDVLYDISFDIRYIYSNKEKTQTINLNKYTKKLSGGDEVKKLYDTVILENNKRKYEIKFNNLFKDIPLNNELNANEFILINKEDSSKSFTIMNAKIIFTSINKI